MMKTERNILIAFILNFLFSLFEFLGGFFTGSIAIISDALHDMGDALSIGISYFLEKISKKQPDEIYTYGYVRYSVMGSLITTVILMSGSLVVIYGAIGRILNPVEIRYGGMIIFAVVGVIVNFLAAWFTKEGDSLNQRSVNLHMLEDVLGWAIVLVGAVIMYFTDFKILDPIMSVCASAFIFISAVANLRRILNIFLEKIPDGIDIETIEKDVSAIDGVLGVHHIHIRSLDGYNNYLTMHIVTDRDAHSVKDEVRRELLKYKIVHVTLELEGSGEHCHDKCCRVEHSGENHHHHHH